jgi:hypothetical protein
MRVQAGTNTIELPNDRALVSVANVDLEPVLDTAD